MLRADAASSCSRPSRARGSRTRGAARSASPATGAPRSGWTATTGLAWAGGYVGDGVGTTNLAGRTLRDLVLGRDTELTRLPWVGHRSPALGAGAAALARRQRRPARDDARRRRGAAHRPAEPRGAGGRPARRRPLTGRAPRSQESGRIRSLRHEPVRSTCTVVSRGKCVSTVSGRKPMRPGTSSRARVPFTIVFTLVIVLGEFGFLQVVYHMDDHVDAQRDRPGAGRRRPRHLAARQRHVPGRGGRPRPGHHRRARRRPAPVPDPRPGPAVSALRRPRGPPRGQRRDRSRHRRRSSGVVDRSAGDDPRRPCWCWSPSAGPCGSASWSAGTARCSARSPRSRSSTPANDGCWPSSRTAPTSSRSSSRTPPPPSSAPPPRRCSASPPRSSSARASSTSCSPATYRCSSGCSPPPARATSR